MVHRSWFIVLYGSYTMIHELLTMNSQRFTDNFLNSQQMNFSSKLLENAVAEFAKLPGVGQKTALRLVLHLLNQDKAEVERFSAAINKLRNEIQFCSICHNIADQPV